MAQAPNVFTTPKGVALYPYLSRPDTKFNEEGEYKVNLVLSKEDAAPIVEQINSVFAANLEEETKKANGKQIKTANPPYSDELDENGKPTGNVIMKFKSKAAYKPAIFDAKGNVMIESNIWGGSEVRFEQEAAPKAELKAEEVFEEPVVKTTAAKPDNSDGMSTLINKWSQS